MRTRIRPDQVAPYVRYALIFFSAWLLASDAIPEPLASVLARVSLDPALVADLAGLISAAAAVVWYQYSRAKAALDGVVK